MIIIIEKFHKGFKLYQVFIHNSLSQNVSILPKHILHTQTESVFITSTTSKFFQKKLITFLISRLLLCTNPTILLDAILEALIPCLNLFYMLCVV